MVVIFGVEELIVFEDMKDVVDYEIEIVNVIFYFIYCLIMLYLK